MPIDPVRTGWLEKDKIVKKRPPLKTADWLRKTPKDGRQQ